MNLQLATLFERLSGRTSARRFLPRLGLDAEQFVLFLALFRTLSEREGHMDAIGVDRFRISYLALYAAVIGLVPWSLFVGFFSPPAPVYLLVNLAITFLAVFLIFIREMPNTLFNPVEASVIAHRPVHAPTYLAAKIAHVLIAVLYLVCGMTAYPALIGVVLEDARWFWPLTHMAAGILTGLTTAFLISTFYSVLARFLPAGSLKGISIWIQILTIFTLVVTLMFELPTSLLQILTIRYQESLWAWLPWSWCLQTGLLGWRWATWSFEWQAILTFAVTALIIWFGIRSLAGSYFTKASFMVEGQSRRTHRKRIASRAHTTLVRTVTGSPNGVGAFFFVHRMMQRDWAFRRAFFSRTWVFLFVAILFIAFSLLVLVRTGSLPSFSLPSLQPFDEGLIRNLLPHFLGLVAIGLCVNLTYTEFQRGSWIYLTAPLDNLRAYARGIYWSLWIPTVFVPHLVMFLLMVRSGDGPEATLATGFSLVVVSIYLGFGITRIPGMPFSAPQEQSRTMLRVVFIQYAGLVLIHIPAVLQQHLFQIRGVAVISLVLLAVAAWFVVRWALGALTEEIRWRMYLMKSDSNPIFKEIE